MGLRLAEKGVVGVGLGACLDRGSGANTWVPCPLLGDARRRSAGGCHTPRSALAVVALELAPQPA